MTAKKLARRRGKKTRKKATKQAAARAVPVQLPPPERLPRTGDTTGPAIAKLAARRAPTRAEIDGLLPGLANALRGLTLLLEFSKLTSHQMTVLVEPISRLMLRLPQAVLVKAYGHNRTMLGTWQKEGAPRNADPNKTWNHPGLATFLRERWKAQRGKQLPLEMNWPERLQKAKALAAERENSLSEARLVSRDLVERLFSELAQVLKRSLRRLPELATRLVPSKGKPTSETVARELLASYRDQAVAELSRMAAECAEGLNDKDKGA